MSSQKSHHRAPLENAALHPFERIQRWTKEVHREMNTYHDCHTPFKSIEDSDDYGAYPPQKVSLEHLLFRRPINSDDFEGQPSACGPSGDESPDHDKRHPPAPQDSHKHKRSFPEPHDEKLASKHRRVESSSLGDSLTNRALRARHRGDLSHSLKESTPRVVQGLENNRSRSGIHPDEEDEVDQEPGHDASKLQKSYERQPRRKTRADKYEPKVTEKPSKSHRAKEPKKSKQIHSAPKIDFRAPNVPQQRLTLKSGQYLGIFAKGKASSPVHRRGLPDLSFPEMNFLASHKDRQVEPVFPAAARQLSKRKPIRTEQDKMSERFSRPLVDQNSSKHSKSDPHRGLRGSSNHSPHKSTANLRTRKDTPEVVSKIGSFSPEKLGASGRRGVSLRLSDQENAPPRPVYRSIRQGLPGHTEEDAPDHSTLYFPWSTSNGRSQKPPRQPLGDVSKKYLTLEDLHQLLQKRQQEDQEDEAEASGNANPDNQGEQTSYGTPSLFKSVEYQSMPSRYRQSAPSDNVELRKNQGRVPIYSTPAASRLPDMYAGQFAEPEGFRIFEDSPDERRGHRHFMSGGPRQYGPENENVDTLPAPLDETSSASPSKLWNDPQGPVEEYEEEVSFFKPSVVKSPTRYIGNPQTTVTFIPERNREPQLQYGDLPGRAVRRPLMEGVGEPFGRKRVIEKAHDLGASALLLSEQEVSAELASKGFWRPRRM